MPELCDKVIAITGASGGVGAAAATRDYESRMVTWSRWQSVSVATYGG